jgi:hypothetical protein
LASADKGEKSARDRPREQLDKHKEQHPRRGFPLCIGPADNSQPLYFRSPIKELLD